MPVLPAERTAAPVYHREFSSNPAGPARREASAALERVRSGFDPSEEKRQRRLLIAPEADTFGAVLQDYLERTRRNMAPGTFKEAKRVLEREFLRSWRNRPIGSITRGDINRIIDATAARGAEIQANRSLAYLRAFFNWAVERGRIAVSPVTGMKPPTKERPRDRVLSDDEIRWLWRGCDALDWPFGPLAKLLLLTAQRRDEVAGMERQEIDLEKRIWTLPGEGQKQPIARDTTIGRRNPRFEFRSARRQRACVHKRQGARPRDLRFSRAKLRLDVAMLAAKREELGAKAETIPNWTLHDLRRTAATGMARLNFPPHVVDKVLNHVSGTIRGVAAVYNRFEYLEERRAALEAWGRLCGERRHAGAGESGRLARVAKHAPHIFDACCDRRASS